MVNARVDTFLYGDGDVADAVARGRCYVAAGADCVYPILAPVEALAELAAATGAPVNALALPDGPSPSRLGELGASRVSFGHTLHARAGAALRELSRDLAGGEQDGDQDD